MLRMSFWKSDYLGEPLPIHDRFSDANHIDIIIHGPEECQRGAHPLACEPVEERTEAIDGPHLHDSYIHSCVSP